MLDEGPKGGIRPQCRVTTPLWAPGADSGQRAKNDSAGRNSNRKMAAAHALGLPGYDTTKLKEPFNIYFSGHSVSVLRDSAVYLRK